MQSVSVSQVYTQLLSDVNGFSFRSPTSSVPILSPACIRILFGVVRHVASVSCDLYLLDDPMGKSLSAAKSICFALECRISRSRSLRGASPTSSYAARRDKKIFSDTLFEGAIPVRLSRFPATRASGNGIVFVGNKRNLAVDRPNCPNRTIRPCNRFPCREIPQTRVK